MDKETNKKTILLLILAGAFLLWSNQGWHEAAASEVSGTAGPLQCQKFGIFDDRKDCEQAYLADSFNTHQLYYAEAEGTHFQGDASWTGVCLSKDFSYANLDDWCIKKDFSGSNQQTVDLTLDLSSIENPSQPDYRSFRYIVHHVYVRDAKAQIYTNPYSGRRVSIDSFTVNQTQINLGDSVQVCWATDWAMPKPDFFEYPVRLDRSGTAFSSGGIDNVNPNDCASYAPDQAGTATFTLRAGGPGDITEQGIEVSQSLNVTVTSPPPPGEPDLNVRSVSPNAPPVAGGSVQFDSEVRNDGTVNSASTWETFALDGAAPFDTQSVDPLVPGDSDYDTSVSVTFTPADVGSHTVTVCAGQVSGETNTGNNCLTDTFIVAAAGSPTADIKANGSDSAITVNAGDTVTLSWTSSNASSCSGTNFNTGGATSGSTNVTVNSSTTYSVNCNGATDSVQVNVTSLPGTSTVGGRVVDQTGAGVGGVSLFSCTPVVPVTNSQGYWSVSNVPIRTGFCLRINSLPAGYSGGTSTNNTPETSWANTYEWQVSGVYCRQDGGCSGTQDLWDIQSDSALNFQVQKDTGNIDIHATLNGSVWPSTGSGSVSYQILGPSTLNGSAVPNSFTNQNTGVWNFQYQSGGPAGATLSSITPAASQTLTGGSTITFNMNFSSSPPNPPNAPSNLRANNSVCSQITLNWNDTSSNEDGFRVYRGTTAGGLSLIDSTGANVTTYTDTPAPGVSYYYGVSAFNAAGESSQATTGPVFNSACAANLSLSDKVIDQVNGNNYTGQSLNNGDVLTFKIIISNTGNAPAYDVYVDDTLSDNLTYSGNPQIKYGTGPLQSTTASVSGQSVTINSARNLGDKAADNNNWLVFFDATITSTSSQSVDFIRNDAVIRYAGSEGGLQDRGKTVTTGLTPVDTGQAKVPTIREIAP